MFHGSLKNAPVERLVVGNNCFTAKPPPDFWIHGRKKGRISGMAAGYAMYGDVLTPILVLRWLNKRMVLIRNGSILYGNDSNCTSAVTVSGCCFEIYGNKVHW